jgi:DNA-binding HxlR family transcriptional regulator
MFYLIQQGKKRPNELHKAMPEASRRVLDLQLRELEFHGIIKRVIYPQVPPKVEYYLTEFGKTLLPVIETMDAWGAQYLMEFEHMMRKKELPSSVS